MDCSREIFRLGAGHVISCLRERLGNPSLPFSALKFEQHNQSVGQRPLLNRVFVPHHVYRAFPIATLWKSSNPASDDRASVYRPCERHCSGIVG